MSTTSRKAASAGEMTNLIAVNAQLFITIIPYLNMIWSSPLQIILCIYMLWRYLGIAAFAGLATTIIFIPLNVFATNKNKILSVKKLNMQDQRIKILNEILGGIKVIKFYGWELSFQKIVEKVREREMKYFTHYALVSIITIFTWASAPFFVSVVSYATFVLIDPNNNLDPNTAFVTFTLFYLIRFPLALLPQTITFVVQGYVSLKRIKSFLLLDETNENDVQRGPITSPTGVDLAISIKKANMGWNKNEVFLYNLNFDIRRSKLIAVVGGVGSGKSSLLSALLGEMHKLNYGQIQVNGSTAYVPQQAWIQNATIRENILFGHDYDNRFYTKIINACSLLTDFNIMPHGDSTEIGEKGINLSGGQKQRISLARAIYANADIYMLDDPLSAVDAHVGKHIFDHVIGPNGMLKNKTRLFVTNSLSFLPQVDHIFMLENGTIAESGSYEELKDREGSFADFIKNFLANEKDHNLNESVDDVSHPSSLSSSLRSVNIKPSKSKPPTIIKRPDSSLLESSSIFGSGLIGCDSKLGSAGGNGTTGGQNGIGGINDDHLIEKDEIIESGSIKIGVIWDYMKKSGILNSVLFCVFFISSNVALVASSFWLSAWSNDVNDERFQNVTEMQPQKHYRLSIYVIIGFGQCFLLNIANMVLVAMCIRSSKAYHTKILSSILRSTLYFFESTPAGRIINSKLTKPIYFILKL